MWSSVIGFLFAVCVAFTAKGTTGQEGAVDCGYSEDTVIQSAGRYECTGARVYNHDDSFENGYCWEGAPSTPPYYGAWGEAYDLGEVTVECGVYWFTAAPGSFTQWIDIYIWDGGLQGPPGNVLYVASGVPVQNVPYWPAIGACNLEIGCCVNGDFTVGYWDDRSQTLCELFCAADENGSGGYPWTCIAPGTGYPSGWQHPNVVHPNCVSMGIGVTVTSTPSPAESQTWGAIKSTFRR